MSNKDKYYLFILSTVLFIALMLFYPLVFGTKQIDQDIPDVIKQIIPNLLASLLAFSCIYFFIDRIINKKSINEHTIGYLEATDEVYSQYKSSLSFDDLRKLEETLKKEREKLKIEIDESIASLKTSTNNTDKTRFEKILGSLSLRLNSIDSRVSIINERLILASEIDNKDKKIEELNNEVKKLNKIIDSNKMIAKEISENIKKI